MKNLGIVVNCRKPHAPKVLERLAGKAHSLGMNLFVVCGEEGGAIPGAARLSEAELVKTADVLLALGGDGTVLRAARILAGSDKPVLGVNLGSLGFMTSVTEQNLDHALEALKHGQCTISNRSVAECRVTRDGKDLGCFRGLNDVVLGWGESSRVITLDVELDGVPVASYKCDGLIVSTPTGSTGHSLSAGGPILHPDSPCFVITVICPHTVSNRPLVISDRSVVVVHVAQTTKHVLLSVDGQEEMAIQQGDRLDIRRAEKGVRFLHLPDYSYFSVLQKKLLWRGSSAVEG